MRFRYRLFLLMLVACFAASANAQAPKVVDVSPVAQTVSASATAPIVVTFDQPVDPDTITPQSVRVFGRWSGPAAGQLALVGDGRQVRFTPDAPFFAGEWITVSLSKTITHAGTPMETGYAWNYWIETQPGTLDQEEIGRMAVRQPGEGVLQVYGAYAGDLNDDGWSDLTVINERANGLRVYLNDQVGGYDSYTRYVLPPNSLPSPNEGGDFNNDGYIDLAVAAIGNDHVSVLLGDGAGGFYPQVDYPAHFAVRGLGVMDLNGDGHDDIVTTNRTDSNLSLLMNEGDGTFAAPIAMPTDGQQETAIAITDANGDGLLDAFVGAYASGEIFLLLGDGQGGLDVSARMSVQGRPWMIAAGDFDGDGHADVVSANSSGNNASVLFGDGQGGLSVPVTYATGGFPLAMDTGDLDGDGDLDLVTSNFSTADWTLYENDGTGRFINRRRLRATAAASCAILHDRDNDGDLDITGTDEIDDLLFFFENSGTPTSTDDEEVPERFELAQNVPNPFRHKTTISFSLPDAAFISLNVYDVLGRKVATLAEGMHSAGTHTLAFESVVLPGGVYLYRLQAPGVSQTRRLIVVQ